MAPLQDLCNSTKVLPFLLYILVLSSSFYCSSSSSLLVPRVLSLSPLDHQIQSNPNGIEVLGRRSLLELQSDDDSLDDQLLESPPIKKKKSPPSSSSSSPSKGTTFTASNAKNKTKLIKPTTNSTKPIKPTTNSTKPIKPKSPNPSLSAKNKTKPIELLDKSDKPINIKLKKLNSTKPISKTSNSTKPISLLSQKSTSSDPSTKLPKNKTTTKPNSPQGKAAQKNPTKSNWMFEDEDGDLVAEFRDLPGKFQETLLPDLEKISTTSKVYIDKANKEISKGVKPIVGKKYAPTVATVVSFAFVLIPFLLVSLIFNRIKAYFSLQKLLIFIQIYLSIYFSILCLSSLVTGLEPLKFFYATSQSTYVCIQLLQTLAYVLYLLVLLMYFVLVFSTDCGMVARLLGLAQMFVGFAVGLHYYMTVFHRAVLRQPPKTSWKVHAVYATCFFLICLLAGADRRKKEYVADGGEEGKKS